LHTYSAFTNVIVLELCRSNIGQLAAVMDCGAYFESLAQCDEGINKRSVAEQGKSLEQHKKSMTRSTVNCILEAY
jgi:hypothetical protein